MSDTLPTGLAPDFLAKVALFFHTLPGGDTLFMLLAFVVVLSILVFVHEYGHYRAALSVGVRVQSFSIGFGKALFSWVDKRGTIWQVAWLPLGGYVQMLGMDEVAPLSASQKAESFQNKNLWQRAWVIAAGPLANIAFAFVLLCVVMLTGEQRLKADVGEVQDGMPAAGVLQKGDELTALNGVKIEDWDGFQAMVQANMDKPLEISLVRGGVPMAVSITPKVTEFTDLLGTVHTVGRVGVGPSYQRFVVAHPPVQAVGRAAAKTWELTALTVESLGKLMIGAIAPNNLTGPLGIADMAGQTAAAGLFAVLMFMVIISVNLGIVNLLPLPVLDGGHLVFLLVEAVRGRPVGPRVQEYASRLGLGLIVSVAVFATLNDVQRLGWVEKIKDGVSKSISD